jgi:hypothetical protein
MEVAARTTKFKIAAADSDDRLKQNSFTGKLNLATSGGDS